MTRRRLQGYLHLVLASGLALFLYLVVEQGIAEVATVRVPDTGRLPNLAPRCCSEPALMGAARNERDRFSYCWQRGAQSAPVERAGLRDRLLADSDRLAVSKGEGEDLAQSRARRDGGRTRDGREDD